MQTALTISPVLLSHWHKPTLHRQKMSDFTVPLPLSAACSLTEQLVLMVISLCQATEVFPTPSPAQIHPDTHRSGQHHHWCIILSTARV